MYEKKKTSFLCINHFLFCHFFMFVWRREYNFLDISALSGKCGNKKIFIFKLFFRRIYCETNHLSYTSFWLFFFFIFQFWKKKLQKKNYLFARSVLGMVCEKKRITGENCIFILVALYITNASTGERTSRISTNTNVRYFRTKNTNTRRRIKRKVIFWVPELVMDSKPIGCFGFTHIISLSFVIEEVFVVMGWGE